MIRRIAEDGDFFTIPDRYGRFHSNLTNLKKTLRPFLRYRDSELVNLDIANSQPMVFCLPLVNLLSNNGKLGPSGTPEPVSSELTEPRVLGSVVQ